MPNPPRVGCPLHEPTGDTTEYLSKLRQQEALLTTGALQSAIFNSANFSSSATDALGIIPIFNVGTARVLGSAAGEVINKITAADLSDRQELIDCAAALDNELGIVIAPGFEPVGFMASRITHPQPRRNRVGPDDLAPKDGTHRLPPGPHQPGRRGHLLPLQRPPQGRGSAAGRDRTCRTPPARAACGNPGGATAARRPGRAA